MGEVWLTAGITASAISAQGQILPISQFPALYSLLGTIYGGDGRTTFALPALRDVAPNDLSYVICVEGVSPQLIRTLEVRSQTRNPTVSTARPSPE